MQLKCARRIGNNLRPLWTAKECPDGIRDRIDVGCPEKRWNWTKEDEVGILPNVWSEEEAEAYQLFIYVFVISNFLHCFIFHCLFRLWMYCIILTEMIISFSKCSI